jgi:rapamycin-insensitive companion of mTOR
MFFDLLNIKPPEWYQTFIDGRRLTSEFFSLSDIVKMIKSVSITAVYRKSRQAPDTQTRSKESEPAQKPQPALKLTDQYIALLIRVFSAAGLLDVCLW